MAWSLKDLNALKNKGLKVDEQFPNHKSKFKQEKISVEKNTIELILNQLMQDGKITEYRRELRFDDVRQFRFDWAIPELMLAIEYEGIFSDKSGHTTISGYVSDCTKYNLAQSKGWKVLRYTAKNYLEFPQDIEHFLSKL
ncbi:hypothetical protein [Flavobacterium sp.]|uniref:hypothetical protein n=1 Tax=Flavobacterium sp. TaxID=239 RepID=UPI00261976BB|nr:hypothetical protein [Flavobacterium sp.]